MAYESATKTFTFYSEDFNMLGDNKILISAHLTDYPSMTSSSLGAETPYITVKNPCLDPISV